MTMMIDDRLLVQMPDDCLLISDEVTGDMVSVPLRRLSDLVGVLWVCQAVAESRRFHYARALDGTEADHG